MQYNWLTDWGLEKQNDKIQRGQVMVPTVGRFQNPPL